MRIEEDVHAFSRPLNVSLVNQDSSSAKLMARSLTEDWACPSTAISEHINHNHGNSVQMTCSDWHTKQRLSEIPQDDAPRSFVSDQSFVKDIEIFLNTRERSRAQRKQALYREWEDKVTPSYVPSFHRGAGL